MPDIDALDTTFEGLPPFPTDVPTAPLLRLSLEKLSHGNSTECERLWDACTKLGFFYLDLRSSPNANGANTSNGATNEHIDNLVDGHRFIEDADRLFDVAKEFFALPVEEKTTYDLSSEGSYFGYKGYGAGYVDKHGNKDRNEFYNTSKDDILGLSAPLPQPDCLTPHRPLLATYMRTAHAIVTLLLKRLNQRLGLAPDLLPDLHSLTHPSGDQVRFVRAPPQPLTDRQVALGAHTDFGSLTLLFNRLGGLQVFPPPEALRDMQGSKDGEWLYVRPLPGHCIVNLGDAMVKFTGGILKSATHRVVNPPGEAQGQLVRESLVYFARPVDEVLLGVLKGRGSEMIDHVAEEREANGETDEVISAKEWTLRRALGRRGVKGYERQGMAGTEIKGVGV